jgi:competence protein ComEA
MRRSVLAIVVGICLLASGIAIAGTEGAPARKDINTAESKDLVKVKGIGKKIAQKILDKRTEMGKFTSMYQLKEIKGLGKATLNKLICAFYVESEGELPCQAEVKAQVKVEQKINLNTADAKELTKLKGMGKKKAQAIIEYRQENGWFRSPHELTNIKGIGKKTVENFLPYLEVRLDVNTARAAQFEALGFANGDAIIEARQKAGGFKTVEEIGKLPGIDAEVWEKAKPVLIVNEPAA